MRIVGLIISGILFIWMLVGAFQTLFTENLKEPLIWLVIIMTLFTSFMSLILFLMIF